MDPRKWDPIVQRVLAGIVGPEELPEIPQRVVRVYLSSTGSDSQTERNAFVERVYPRLREYSSQRYGVDFQMVDLEWGLPPHDRSSDPASEDFRYKELHKCHSLSVGPSFVAFVGQKYGDCPLPSMIPAIEFEAIRVALRGHKGRETRSAPLLDEWYKKDDNSIPEMYILQPIRSKLPEFNDSDENKRSIARTKWYEDEGEMRRMLQKGAEISYLEGLLDGDTKQKYHMSGQDMCIQQGTEESGSPHSRCVLLMRSIVDLKNYVDDAKASEFTEITFNERTERLEVDEVCSTKLSQLKTRAKGLISNNNSLQYEVLWRYDDVIHPKLHAPYLNKLCAEFYEALKNLIDETVPKTSFDVEPEIYEEVLTHWVRCKRKAIDFYGQEQTLDKVQSYLDGNSNTPFVVYGPSGSGKSTLLSKLATETATGRIGTICAIRFIGLTPKSSDIKQVVMTLCSQLLLTLGRPNNDIPYDFKDIQRYFHELLNSIPSDINVVIFLDSLETLIPEYNAYFMSWLPSQLKSNIKIVVSVHPEQHNILEKLKTEILKSTDCMLEIPRMSESDAEGLMQYTLGLFGRTVAPNQLVVFRNAFNVCSYPMYVQLLTDIAKNMASYEVLDANDIPKNITDAINKFFDKLEAKHGKMLVGRSLGYLVASVTGLSDCEMEDLLSLDDDVLNSVYVTYHPPVRRIPFLKWLQVKNDIEQFLDYREADGITVYMWYHEQFEEVVRRRYLKDEKVVMQVHSMLADYFLGTWAGKMKPINPPATNNGIIPVPIAEEADRLVALQPLSFESPGVPERFNKRKYDQVPRHLYLAGRFKELNSLVLFNYEWLYNKIKALSLTHIMADFVLNPGEEATLVEEALRVAEQTILKDINNLAPEISGHLLPYFKTHPNIRALVQQCDTNGLQHCALVPNFPYLQVPGSSLQYTLTSEISGEFFRFTNDDRYLLTKVKDSSVVYVFDVATGEAKGTVFASNGDLYVTPNGKLFVIVDHVTEKAIKIHNSDTGAYVGQLIVMNHIQLKLKEKYKMGAVSLTDERLSVIVTTETSYLCIADLKGCQFLQIIGLDGKCDICQVTPNGKYVFCNSNEFILCYDMYSLEHICTVSAGHRPNALTFTKDGFRAFLANPVEAKLLVMHVHRGAVEMAYKTPLEEDMPDDRITSLRVSPKDDTVLIRGKNNILLYNRFNEKVSAKFPRPDDVPKEFKLPKTHYIDLFYTNAEFSRDGNFVIGSIFRNIYVWQVSTGSRITTIQAPVGIITELLVSKSRSQVITHIRGSKDIQVWNVNKAVNQVNMLDKLTGVVTGVRLSSDNGIAYVQCKGSDELGVIDMRNGIMLDLLTHDAPVRDFACTPDGQYVIISSDSKRRNAAIKIWEMNERKVVKELGNTTGFCLGAHKKSAVILVAQEELSFKAPFYITNFTFMTDGFRENTHPLSLKYVLGRPFLTEDDQNVVVLTAQDYMETEGVFDTPTICAFSLENDLKVSYYTPESFRDAVNICDIKDLKPCSDNANAIIVIFNTNQNAADVNDNSNKGAEQLGLLILDINTGAINTICEPFLKPGVPIDSLIFSGSDYCIDHEYFVFDISRGMYAVQLANPGVPPSLVALRGSAVIYYKGSRLSVVSVGRGLIATCEVHATISNLTLCSDQRTIIVGCDDGTIVSYVLIDSAFDEPNQIIAKMGSRSLDGIVESGRTSRAWDKVENDKCPDYSRPPSAVSHGPKEKILLKQIKAAPKLRPNSDTLLYLNDRSKSCVLQ